MRVSWFYRNLKYCILLSEWHKLYREFPTLSLFPATAWESLQQNVIEVGTPSGKESCISIPPLDSDIHYLNFNISTLAPYTVCRYPEVSAKVETTISSSSTNMRKRQSRFPGTADRTVWVMSHSYVRCGAPDTRGDEGIKPFQITMDRPAFLGAYHDVASQRFVSVFH